MSYVHEATFLSSETAGKVAKAGMRAVGGGLNHFGPFRVYPGNKWEKLPGVFEFPRQVGFLLSDLLCQGALALWSHQARWALPTASAVTAANKHSGVRLSRMFSELEFERCFPFSQPTPSVLRLWLSQQDTTVRGQRDGLSPHSPHSPHWPADSVLAWLPRALSKWPPQCRDCPARRSGSRWMQEPEGTPVLGLITWVHFWASVSSAGKWA